MGILLDIFELPESLLSVVLGHVQLLATAWTIYSPPASSVHGIFQARILQWIATSSSMVCSGDIFK